MNSVKLTLRHGDLLKTSCSAVFLKHIEATLSAPELSLDGAVNGRLSSFLSEHEREDHSILFTEGLIAAPLIYVVNFHKEDLPFSYHSVDRYARTIVRVTAGALFNRAADSVTVATAVHGPGAGLDASEAMETLVLGLGDELAKTSTLGQLGEVMLIERDREVFLRLEERLRYLATHNRVRFDGSDCFVDASPGDSRREQESERIDRLSRSHLFVAMPYDQEFNNAYYFGIKNPIEQRGRKCERVDQDAFTGDIVKRIKARISTSELMIADITGNNPNVFYEIGYAEGVGKPVILISQDQEIPFDLQNRRQIRYDPQDILSLANQLGQQLDALIPSADT